MANGSKSGRITFVRAIHGERPRSGTYLFLQIDRTGQFGRRRGARCVGDRAGRIVQTTTTTVVHWRWRVTAEFVCGKIGRIW